MYGGPTKLCSRTRQSITSGGGPNCQGATALGGVFGENLSTQGLMEEDVQIGDEFGFASSVPTS